MTAQKDAIKYITSDSQVNSYFPYKWSPARLTLDIYFTYFYLFLYLNITKITISNYTPHLKSPKKTVEHRWSMCITLEGNYIEKEEVDLNRK